MFEWMCYFIKCGSSWMKNLKTLKTTEKQKKSTKYQTLNITKSAIALLVLVIEFYVSIIIIARRQTFKNY